MLFTIIHSHAEHDLTAEDVSTDGSPARGQEAHISILSPTSTKSALYRFTCYQFHPCEKQEIVQKQSIKPDGEL